MNTRSTLGTLVAVFIGAAANGQSFNIDFGTGTTTPAATYGAGANQVGFWNNITNAAALNAPLSDLSGAATAATISLDGGAMLNLTGSSPNGVLTPAGSNAERLLDDLWDPSLTTGIITINNLAPGTYNIYTYGLAPDSATDLTGVTVVGAVEGNQQVGGQLPNPFNDQYSSPLTHALHTLTVVGGPVVINIDTAGGAFESVNGLQIVLVPVPGAFALLGLAGLVGPRRRRN